MNAWFGKVAVLVSILGYIFIRWPHGKRSGDVRIAEDRAGCREVGLLIFAFIGTTLVPVLWMMTRLFEFAEYQLYAFTKDAALFFGGVGPERMVDEDVALFSLQTDQVVKVLIRDSFDVQKKARRRIRRSTHTS